MSVGEVELIFKPHPDDVERLKREAENNAKNTGASNADAVATAARDGPETADRFIRTTGESIGSLKFCHSEEDRASQSEA